MNKQFILQLAGVQMQSAGTLLRMQAASESNPANKKRDNVIGKVLNEGGNALLAFGVGNVHGVDQDLKLIADSIYDYLSLPVPAQSGG